MIFVSKIICIYDAVDMNICFSPNVGHKCQNKYEDQYDCHQNRGHTRQMNILHHLKTKTKI